MRKLLVTAGLSLILASSSATAAPAGKATPPSNDGSDLTYCIRLEPDTGSHYARTECRTKAEWKRLGVDVDELTKK